MNLKFARRLLKITGFIILILVTGLILMVAGLAMYIHLNVKITNNPEFADSELYRWNRISMETQCACSDGSSYNIYHKPGNSRNLIIHFSGGGACWDDSTCTEPLSLWNLKGFYYPDINEFLLKVALRGIMDNHDKNNPFYDWNIVFIPYCTGDLHIGDTANTYTGKNGNKILVRHFGRRNVKSALNWIFRHYDSPEKILISGESAGGFGNIVWTPEIADHYNNSILYQISDCSLVDSQVWPEALKLWNSDMAGNYGFESDQKLILRSLLNSAQKLEHKKILFLQSFSSRDVVLLRYFSEINNVSTSGTGYIDYWTEDLNYCIKTAEDSIENYYFFISGCNPDEENFTPHTFLTSNQFYLCTEQDTSFQQWLAQCVIRNQPVSTGRSILFKQ